MSAIDLNARASADFAAKLAETEALAAAKPPHSPSPAKSPRPPAWALKTW